MTKNESNKAARKNLTDIIIRKDAIRAEIFATPAHKKNTPWMRERQEEVKSLLKTGERLIASLR